MLVSPTVYRRRTPLLLITRVPHLTSSHPPYEARQHILRLRAVLRRAHAHPLTCVRANHLHSQDHDLDYVLCCK